ncbi:MAG TPA: DUF1059 domain-containing protein [Opitutaceae bacterium]|nr:DUF1059 domain-containing protein [Opitutaceae bacterium]
MKTFPALTALVAAATLAVASLTVAADPSKKATPAPLKSISCPPECGFMCRSHDEKELIEIVKAHALKAHGKVLTDEQLKSFMQAEPAAAPAGKS